MGEALAERRGLVWDCVDRADVFLSAWRWRRSHGGTDVARVAAQGVWAAGDGAVSISDGIEGEDGERRGRSWRNSMSWWMES